MSGCLRYNKVCEEDAWQPFTWFSAVEVVVD